MTLDMALRLTEILLALAFLQSSAEHMFGPLRQWALFAPRAAGAVLLLTGVAVPWVLIGLCAHGLVLLHRFDGAYNGGADKMALLVLGCLTAAHLGAPGIGLGYLAVQTVLSYFVSGWVKLRNPDWRTGQALVDVFAASAYPVAEDLRRLATRPALLRAGSWAVIALEVAFPLSLSHPLVLAAALSLAFVFHLANAVLFGLNRFVWSWLASYPALVWFQGLL